MSNKADAKARREEEIAFLAMEQVLGVDIVLADAGGGESMPDGLWTSHDGQTRGIVEITSPPASGLMAQWARAKREGRRHVESGSVPVRLNELADVITEMFATEWARENIRKLRAQQVEQRHLFLFGRSYDVQHYLYRLSDRYEVGFAETVDDLVLPEGISDVWFRGRARRHTGKAVGTIELRLARYQSGVGWQRHAVEIDELDLPSPAPGIADDPVPAGLRRPKDRSPARQDPDARSAPRA